ncbi:MAG: virulence protein [Bacteroidetes bacterium HGW-Bacteroidetes-16]|jgi:predicted P-loop ATPase|nr:MAG: virulence protein [Bacteroidetes bacterium HGW-Bacteroidetes-16]
MKNEQKSHKVNDAFSNDGLPVNVASSIERAAKVEMAKEKATSKNESIEIILKSKYTFRFNTIKCQPEFKINEVNSVYKPIDKYVLNTLKRELDSEFSITTTTDNLRSILESTFSLKVNPIDEYFRNLPEFDPDADYIKEFSQTVKVEDPILFCEYFKKWIVAVVANALTKYGCQNHTALVFTGDQGKFKTTWLDLLCPQSLHQYIFTGKLNLQSKDTSSLIAEMFLINIDDQLRQINNRDENELKNLITTPSIKYRRPYDIYITEYPHTASFMASVNGNDFLTDPTGSRRFLPFEVLEIDIEKAKEFNINLVYSQAFYLYKNDFRYWFDEQDTAILHKNNQAFQMTSLEEQLLLEFFRVPENKEEITHHLQPAMILEHIEKQTKNRLSLKKLGEALNKNGFKKIQKTDRNIKKWVWQVIRLELFEVDLASQNKKDYSQS